MKQPGTPDPFAKTRRECRSPIEVVIVRPSPVYPADEPERANRVEPAAGERIEYLKALRSSRVADRMAAVLDAEVVEPESVDLETLGETCTRPGHVIQGVGL
jgi:hypothetical protein